MYLSLIFKKSSHRAIKVKVKGQNKKLRIFLSLTSHPSPKLTTRVHSSGKCAACICLLVHNRILLFQFRVKLRQLFISISRSLYYPFWRLCSIPQHAHSHHLFNHFLFDAHLGCHHFCICVHISKRFLS